ncbi:TfoX/Sxy family DNA transformation protein [Roseicyclus mahoneyensis]|jgi:DNA transformation protein and related proteins|uniref:TfoX-like protein n=1 Tax=Roseicyclus mahoneyensis TaxID=164332 RepID=A0A316GP67_9RHOB|nr:TfoX/Sxy family DNA transformation protein [Roseicyclus mahoneyensis]PWK62950.1 TfoX-like protein [Roseicyclus mahoneyensis]
MTDPQTPRDDTDPVTAIRHIGPAQAEAMARAGILTATALRQMGADAAYRAMVSAGTQPHFIGYYALHMALQGRPWNDCKGDEKTALRARFDALKADLADLGDDGALERFLDQIGTGNRR